MPNPHEPISTLLAKGHKHLTQEKIQRRMTTESATPADDIQLPEYLPKEQQEEFSALVEELRRIKIIGSADAGELVRYVVARDFYARYTKLLRILPKKKRVRLWELQTKLAAEGGRTVAVGKETDDKDVALELERGLVLLQDKYFTRCEATARALGLNITSRRKLITPQEPLVSKSNRLERF